MSKKDIMAENEAASKEVNKPIDSVLEGFEVNKFLHFILRKKASLVPTAETQRLSEQVIKVIETGACGAVIAGNQRLGKTSAITLIERKIKEHFGGDIPVMVWRSCPDYSKKNDKSFFTELTKAFGFPAPHARDTTFEIRTRLINSIILDAERTQYRTVVLFIDEAQNLAAREYNWLIQLYNEIEWEDCALIVFLVGQEEDLKADLSKFRDEKKGQIIGRFYSNFLFFHGIRNTTDLRFCLYSFDNFLEYRYKGVDGYSNLKISRDLFPYSYKKETGLTDMTSVIWAAFSEVNEEASNKKSLEIPMQYMVAALAEIIERYSIVGSANEGKGVYPDVSAVKDCVISTSFQYYSGVFDK